MAAHSGSNPLNPRELLAARLVPWLLSLIAIAIAFWISHRPPFQRVSAVVSDEISRSLGFTSRGPVVLVRIDRDFSRDDLQTLLASAIPALVDNYHAAALGVDIDFSANGYDALARSFSHWSSEHPDSARHVVWAMTYDSRGKRGAQSNEPEICADCQSDRCTARFQPRPIFGGSGSDLNYGLAYVWTDFNGVARSSQRYVCSSDTAARLPTFHFKLVETYCSDNPSSESCDSLQPNHQNLARVDAWYETTPLSLCALVHCDGARKGAPWDRPSDALANRIVILYSDVSGCDEHATIAGTRKGSEITASLAISELRFGASNKALVEGVKWTLEALITVLLVLIFHWKHTEHFAVLISGGFFVVYLVTAPRLSLLFPDFRDYVLAVMVAFAIEVWFKAGVQGLIQERK